MQQFQERMDVIGNNVANVNTTGFKSTRVDFAEAFNQQLGADASGTPMQVGTGVGTSAITSSYLQGGLTRTGSDTDLAITGNGFFAVRDTLNNVQYVTRDGSFHLDSDGYLLNSAGMRVQGFSDPGLATRGDIKVDMANVKVDRITAAQATVTAAEAALAAVDPADTAAVATATQALEAANAGLTTAQSLAITRYSIDAEGKVNVRFNDGTQFVRGQVLMQNFQNPQALVKEGNNLYSGLAQAGALSQIEAPGTNGLGTIVAGALEMSNVDLANEFSSLITTQRAFQASARIITTSDDILQELVNLKR